MLIWLIWKILDMLITFFYAILAKSEHTFLKQTFNCLSESMFILFSSGWKPPKISIFKFFSKHLKNLNFHFTPLKDNFLNFLLTLSYCTHKVCFMKVVLKLMKNVRGWSYRHPKIPKKTNFWDFWRPVTSPSYIFHRF